MEVADDSPIRLGDLAEEDVDRIARFLAGRPYVESLNRRLTTEEVSAILVVSKEVVDGVVTFEVTTKAELYGTTASILVIYLQESQTGLRVTWVGDGVIDAE